MSSLIPSTKKFYLFDVIVSGAGYFPVEMLRYDRCIPARESDADKLQMCHLDEVLVKLQHFSLEKNHNLTLERWKSFGWKIEEINRLVS